MQRNIKFTSTYDKYSLQTEHGMNQLIYEAPVEAILDCEPHD